MKRCYAIFSALLLTILLYAAPSDTVTVLFGGDAMGHSPQFQWAYNPQTKTYDYEPNFRYIKPYVEAADLAVVNVELTYGGEPYSGYPNFSTPDSYHDALLGAGFDVMLLANNHILDRGSRGLVRTRSVIGDVPNAGAYLDSLDRAAHYPLICNAGGLRIAIFNCTYGCNGYHALPPQHVNLIDTAEIRRDLLSVRDSAVDLRVMCIHWGVEYELAAVEKQRRLAQWFANAGFDLIIGGHPHVVEDAEMLLPAIPLTNAMSKTGAQKPKGKGRKSAVRHPVPVYYSLGNLISNQRREHTNGGILVRAKIIKSTKEIVSVDYLPCYVHKGTIRFKAPITNQQLPIAQGATNSSSTERHFFLIPTPDYLSGKLPFTIPAEDEAALRRFHDNTVNRLKPFPMF